MVFTLFDGLNQFEWYIHSYFNNLLQYSWNLEHTNKFEFDLHCMQLHILFTKKGKTQMTKHQ